MTKSTKGIRVCSLVRWGTNSQAPRLHQDMVRFPSAGCFLMFRRLVPKMLSTRRTTFWDIPQVYSSAILVLVPTSREGVKKYIYIYTYIYIYIKFVCSFIFLFALLDKFILCLFSYVFRFPYLCLYSYLFLFIYTHTHIYTCIHTCVYIYRYI